MFSSAITKRRAIELVDLEFLMAHVSQLNSDVM